MLNLLSPVKEIMSNELITVSKSDPLTRIEEIFDSNRIHHIPVVEDGNLLGIVSKSDFLFFKRGFNTKEDRYDQYRLKTHFANQIMTTGIATMNSNERINVALEVFKENLFHAIPILENEKLVGIVTTYDIITALAQDKGAINQYQQVS